MELYKLLFARAAAKVGSVFKKLEAGTNIIIEETADGKAKISASGEVSSEDTVARDAIAAIKDGANIDSFADVESALSDKADTSDIPTVPITEIQKNSAKITPVYGVVNITIPTTAADVSALPDTTKYAASLSLTINPTTFVVTGQLKDQNGDNLGEAQTIDLPLESVVVNGSYNSQTKKVVLTLQNGNTIEFSVADLVSGLQTELSANNKLNPAYINYDSTHRAVSDTEKSTWNGKQNAIDSSHKLSADLIDDTNTTNKFATAAELEQIETNKNNILSDLVYAASTGVINLCPVQTKTVNGGFSNITLDTDIPAGEYIVFCGNATSTDTDATTCQVVGMTSTATVVTTYPQLQRGDNVYVTLIAGSPFKLLRFYSSDTAAHGDGDTATFTDIMLIKKSLWDSGITTYTPYAMSNAAITAWIQAQS